MLPRYLYCDTVWIGWPLRWMYGGPECAPKTIALVLSSLIIIQLLAQKLSRPFSCFWRPYVSRIIVITGQNKYLQAYQTPPSMSRIISQKQLLYANCVERNWNDELFGKQLSRCTWDLTIKIIIGAFIVHNIYLPMMWNISLNFTSVCYNLFFFGYTPKNIIRHTAHNIVAWPYPKQWLIIYTSGLMMIIRSSTHSHDLLT